MIQQSEFAEEYCLPAVQANAVPDLDVFALGPARLWSRPDDTFLTDEAPDEVVLTFERGVPVAVDGETVSVTEALQRLNHRADVQGIGRFDGWAAPGAVVLITAHRALEDVTLEPELARFKHEVDRRWTELVDQGEWFSPLKQALDSFVRESQRDVSGEIRLVLHRGRAVPVPSRDLTTIGHRGET